MSHVLIVDDEVEIQEYISEVLSSQLLCDIDLASNGLDGFLKCQHNEYDLVITDHKMPFMMGAALIVAIRSKPNKNKETPILFLSAYIDEALKNSLKIDSLTFAEKPITSEDLVEVVKSITLF
jgi:CheY-like chemotaxis protein